MMKFLIADDHAIVRRGLKQILADSFDGALIDEANDGHEAIEKVKMKEYDIIMLDISMPGKSGLEVLNQLIAENAKQKVLILSVYPEEQYAIRALKAGASGYMTKESTPDEMINAVQKILTGKKYVSSSLAEKLAGELNNNSEKPLHESLSDREFEVLCLIASGKTLKEIADKLCISAKTVSTYRYRILEKMNLKNNIQLTHYAIKNNLLSM